MLTLFALALPLLASSPPQRYGVARIVSRDGYPVLLVRGKPFFIWGAAFFYERIPRSQWRSSLLALQRLHVNTLDLYVPWNWHELADGDFDFDGRTDPRRDLRALLQLANELGFYLIVRPGPVTRNEWRNGGYPAWLLRRPEYEMPLHDVLEGRYPATATLQNTRSDDAAAQWLRNSTHLRYAQRWLRRALAEFRPVAGRVLAVGLDDDQAAYLTNQTWPAPHLAMYLQWLAAIVHDATNPSVPVFINTYQMKVPASSPVWAMGNWYQNSPGSMGEAERLQVLFSTALLGTRPRQPIVLSEFQAGWLLAPEDIYPHETDPTDTMLALHTALDAGARGVVDFPMQDALSPPGWEAPFANRFYDWGAALSLDGKPSPRYAPTLAFGNLVAQDGPLLATTHCVADAAIVWWPSALSMPPTEMQTNAIADATLESERRCLDRELSCALVDLRFATDDELRRYRALILPELPPGARESAFARTRLQRFARAGIVLRSWNDPALRVLIARRAIRGLPGATLHVGPGRLAFLDAVNYGTTALRARITVRYSTIRRHLVLELPARSARLVRLDRSDPPVRPAAPEPATREAGVPIRWGLDAPVSSVGAVVLQDARVRVVVSARAGGRAFVFEDLAHKTNAFTTVGALRDDVSLQSPPSITDRIAAFTHTFPAGMFNRPYDVRHSATRSVALTYTAPDVLPAGARFEKVLSLPASGDTLEVRERLVPLGPDLRQRLVVLSSLAIGATNTNPWRGPLLVASGTSVRSKTVYALSATEPFALYDPRTREFVEVRWAAGAVTSARLEVEDRHAVLRLRYAPGWQTTWYTYAYLPSLAAARARLVPDARQTSR